MPARLAPVLTVLRFFQPPLRLTLPLTLHGVRMICLPT
jgi:hypothetical protein